MNTRTSKLIALLAELARLGIVIWAEENRLRVQVTRDAQIGGLAAEIAANESGLLDVCRETTAADELLYPLAVNQDTNRYLICIHPVHGGISDYRHLALEISDTHSVYGFQALHWLDIKSIPSLQEMASRYAMQLLRRGISGARVVLLGASAGGWIALEMARLLSEWGHEPDLVVLADTQDASAADSAVLRTLLDRFLWVGLLEICAPPELLDVQPAKHPFWTMSRGQRLEYIVERMHALPTRVCRMPPDVTLLEEHLNVYGEYLRVFGGYSPQPYSGRSLYLACSQVGWARATNARAMLCGRSRFATIQGNHVVCLRPEGAAPIVQLIREESMEEGGECADR